MKVFALSASADLLINCLEHLDNHYRPEGALRGLTPAL
jgi:hypothetical protein